MGFSESFGAVMIKYSLQSAIRLCPNILALHYLIYSSYDDTTVPHLQTTIHLQPLIRGLSCGNSSFCLLQTAFPFLCNFDWGDLGPDSAPRSPPTWTYRNISLGRRCDLWQVPEPPRLAAFHAKEQHLQSESPLDVSSLNLLVSACSGSSIVTIG